MYFYKEKNKKNQKHVSLSLYCLQRKHEHLFLSVSNIC